MKATARAGANIAFVKYWGNRDAERRLPLNNSISLTLDDAFTLTTVEFDPTLPEDTFFLNGQGADPPATRRVSLQLDRLRSLAGLSLHARVVSRNSFPTSAGIASSASGFAALTAAAAWALGLDLPPEHLSRLARAASGSACRSIVGGFVEWQAGREDADSYARQIAPPEHWNLLDIVAVVSTRAKQVSSELGHDLATSSPLLPGRLAALPETLDACRAAIQTRDLEALGQVVEADAFSLHAIAMTSRPSALYWECGTVALLQAVREWRDEGLSVYFTIDAGPNVHLLTLPAWRDEVLARLKRTGVVSETLICGPGPGVAPCEDHLF